MVGQHHVPLLQIMSHSESSSDRDPHRDVDPVFDFLVCLLAVLTSGCSDLYF